MISCTAVLSGKCRAELKTLNLVTLQTADTMSETCLTSVSVKMRFSSHLHPFKLIASSTINVSRTGDDLFFEDYLLFGQHNNSSDDTS